MIERSTLSSNSAAKGGGIAARTFSNSSTTIRNTTLSDNSATDGYGGGIYSKNNGTTAIQSSTLSGNSASNAGGGIWSKTYAGGETSIQNSTLWGNSATHFGGGIFSENFSGTTMIEHSTLSGNSGGGIRFSQVGTHLGNCIVAGNDGPDLSPANIFTVSFSLIGDNTGSGLAEVAEARWQRQPGGAVGA